MRAPVDPELLRLADDVDRACRLRGTFTLRSGRQAEEYFDKFLFESDPALLRRVVEPMVALIPSGTEVLGGIELGGVPIAAVLGQMSGLPTAYIRKQVKAYGTCKLAEGPDLSGRRVLLVEDAITTGGAVRDAALAIRELGAVVDTVVCAIDRQEPGGNVLGAIGIEVRSVLNRELLDARSV
ncbi:orotate phosphoribosyltransferase [Microlunatus soli]|uniref:Orotate phosphoribosyltransferase n=1 Tax=Microlunatus soli TaxID=630515 RepID=A0A1H1PNM6_9ACTN|nr:orotate phosphoribosyltransferase [Microlunatus soli]SDS12778.1 orotate phosphoribosyltransferase [Microlunatus soli]